MSARLRFGDVEIDCAAFELRRAGALCPVEPQVFELLTYLARNAGRLVTKDELIEAIWGGRIVSDATLASRIKSARRAIGDDGARQNLIKTVHGRGVRFVGEIQPEPTVVVATDGPAAADFPGRLAIAVLPFQTLGGDPEQSFFADGVVEEITAALSRMRSFTVIARSSTQRYRDQPIDPARVRQELGVRYMVEGSVRRSNGTVRIGARLILAATGAQVWAEHYDGRLDHLFELEDRIALDIVAAVAPTIRGAEIERARRKRPDSLEAYDCVIRALPLVWSLSEEGGEEALRLAAQASRLDPNYALAYALGAWCHFWRFVNDWGPSREATRAEGGRLAREALRLDGGDPDVLTMVSAVEMVLNRDVEAASTQIEKALALNPSSAWGWIRSGYMHVYRGDAAPALQHFARAERLSPFDPMNFNRYLGAALAHFIDRRYDVAVEWAAKALHERPRLFWGYLVQASAHGLLGNHIQATTAAAKVREINPGITVAGIVAVKPFAPDDFGARFAEGLRRAGLPEGGPVGALEAKAVSDPRQPGSRPAIAVLPFQNPSGDPEQSFFADGVVEEITAALSRMRSLMVIARSSTQRYRDQPVDPARIRQELGVRYLVEGSVRRSGGAVRIGARLIDTCNGQQVWAEHYDGALQDLFDLEDRIALHIVAAIGPTIRSAEIERARRKRPDSLEAYDCVMRALPQIWALTRESNAEALRLTAQAIRFDPNYALAAALAGWCRFWEYVNSWSADPEATRLEGLKLAREALRLDDSDADVLAMVGAAEATLGHNLDFAAALTEKAVALDPNCAWAWIRGAYCHLYRGNVDAALQYFARAEKLSPFDPLNFNRCAGVALAHFAAGRYDQAVEWAGKALLERPHVVLGHRVIAAAYAFLGDRARAEAAVRRICEYTPGATIAGILSVLPFESAEIRERLAEGLRRAGLEEDPPAATIAAAPRPSIAVLPFAYIGGDAGKEYLADGLTEDIITDLSRVSGLFVVARNAVFTYRDKPIHIQQVAEELGVRYLLEGSLRAQGRQVRITAQLIDGESGGHVWAERYDRSVDDILALQDEIAQSVVAALRIRLLPQELAAIVTPATANTEAYQYYLMGRSYFLRTGWGQRAMQVARNLFVKAADIDPLYARAYAAIANCDSYLMCMGDADTSFETVLANCARALELEPDLADAHAAKGLALFTAGRTAEGSLALERAMQLAPDSFDAHFFAGRCRRAQGQYAEAAALFERAATLQPDDFRALGIAANCYRALGRLDAAQAASVRCIERIEAELAVHADDAKALAFGAAILAELGEARRGEEWAKRASRINPSDLITNYNLACAWVALGQLDAGIKRLEKMFDVPSGTRRLHLDWMRHDVSFAALRDHPRYRALVAYLESDAPPAIMSRGIEDSPAHR